ncbi:tetratricopeptide repeat protein [Leptolyngbya sp. FACHB-36]|nr:tetratricopeptide repeat protein [Leptolyngbya sp. FACHB-36]
MGEKVAGLSQAAAIAGLGGIGKTQTAIEYAYRYFCDTPTYEWVFWVRADTDLNLVTGLAEIARSLDLRGDKLDELAAQTRRWLETHDRWLLIFDNADEPNLLKPWLPRNPQGRVLLTSRSRRFVSLGISKPIELKQLSLEESIAFLQQRCDRSSMDATELAAVRGLAQALDGLPLALEQAAAYLQQMQVSFAVYWRHYQQRRLELLERGQPETGDYPASVATTWLLNFEQVEQRSPESVPILRLSAVLAGDEIPEQLLLVCAEKFGITDCTDELALAEQLAALANFSLIGREQETASYSIHRLVQAVVWQGLTAAEQQDWINRAIAGLNSVFPDVAKFENWAVCGLLVPHVQAIAAHPSAETLETTDWGRLLNQAGYYLYEQGRYEKAEPLYVRSLQIHEQHLGKDHPDTAQSLNNLAALYESQGRYDTAESLYARALQICEQQSGQDHRNTASSLNNLAALYELQGRYEAAEPLYVRSLHICEQHLGKDHPDTGGSLNNLAALYESQRRYEAAEPLYVRSLHICEQHLGKDHPDTATILNNLAVLYRVQGRYKAAEPLYVRSLHILTSKLGLTHPNTQQARTNLAILYDDIAAQFKLQGRYDKVVEYLEKAIALRQAIE